MFLQAERIENSKGIASCENCYALINHLLS